MVCKNIIQQDPDSQLIRKATSAGLSAGLRDCLRTREITVVRLKKKAILWDHQPKLQTFKS